MTSSCLLGGQEACQCDPLHSYLILTSDSGAVPLNTASASAAVNASTFAEMFIEQNFGPHIEQKCASLKPSSGSVSSCIERAVSGSSDRSNCRFQSNLYRARDSSSSRSRAPGRC